MAEISNYFQFIYRQPTGLILTHSQEIEMRRHVERELPLEACGMIAGITDGQMYRALQVIPITNAMQSPVEYRMQPEEQLYAILEMERGNQELVAVYHSHPNGPPGPSPSDIHQAYYPEAVQLIWSKLSGTWTCQAYLIQGQQVKAVELIYPQIE